MTTLLSKVQYQIHEPGEFIDLKQRSYEETIALIGAFPWKKEREHLAVDLTNPSVTIEGPNNDFLKLALFYNDKFVLHYLSAGNILYTKSFTALALSYPYIRDFFESTVFNPKDFKQENTWMKDNLVHFKTQDFRYEPTPDANRRFLIRSSWLQFVYGILMLAAFVAAAHGGGRPGVVMLLVVFFLLMGGGLNLLIFFNYISHTRNYVLILSKGNDLFYYGDKEDPPEYDKKDIIDIFMKGNSNGRNPVHAFQVTCISFRDGSTIEIPSLFINETAMRRKFSAFTIQTRRGLPVMKNR